MPSFPLSMPIVFGGTSTPYDVAGDIINQAALEMGLSANSLADPYASTNPLYLQLRALLSAVGRRLWRERTWSQLQWAHSFTTTASEGGYALPDNFGRIQAGTAWNTSQTQGLDGLTPQSWRAYRARGLAPTSSILFRIAQQQFELLTDTDTAAGQVITYEYTSRFWVQSDGETDPDKDAPDAADDTIWFAPDLVIAQLKARWKKEKSMPGAQDAQDEADALLDLEMEVDGIPPRLNLSNTGTGIHIIDGRNLPETIG